MPGPVERWLETFMCAQYAEIFDNFGYRTLQSVCQLQTSHLQSMCIPQKHWELVLQNVHILRQSLGCSQTGSQFGCAGDMNSSYNRMSYGNQGMMFPNRAMAQTFMAGGMEGDGAGNYGNEKSSMVNQQLYNQSVGTADSPVYRNHFPGSSPRSQYQQQSVAIMSQYPALAGMASTSPRPGYSGQITGAPAVGHTSIRQSHPHLRTSGQNPQDIANNILHMANSSYPTNHTVQVPLSQNRSTPYHIPSRSPHYNNPQQMLDNYSQMCGDYNQGQFVYPTSSGQMKASQRDMRMSPVSPGMMASPHSQHSAHSIQSSSPSSMHSPDIGNSVRSPMSDLEQRRSHVHQQMMSSPSQRHQQQCMMPSPAGSHGPRMVSPVPPTQQLQVAVSSPASVQHCYRDSIQSGIGQQYTSPQSHHSSQFSPGITATSPSSQYNTMSTGHSSQYGNMSTGHQVASPSSQYGNMSAGHHVASPSSQYSNMSTGHQVASPSSQYGNMSTGHQVASPSSQYGNMSAGHQVASPSSQYGNMSTGHQVASPSSQYGNMSSPYTPGSQMSYHSPPQQQRQSSSLVTHDSAPKVDKSALGMSNPLQSLQKLCMLPDRQVVDPKTVVKETCVQFSNDNSNSKNLKTDNGSPHFPLSNDETTSELGDTDRLGNSTSMSQSETADKIPPKRPLNTENSELTIESKEKCLEDTEMKCQPKKARLMRAVQDELETPGMPGVTAYPNTSVNSISSFGYGSNSSQQSSLTHSTDQQQHQTSTQDGLNSCSLNSYNTPSHSQHLSGTDLNNQQDENVVNTEKFETGVHDVDCDQDVSKPLVNADNDNCDTLEDTSDQLNTIPSVIKPTEGTDNKIEDSSSQISTGAEKGLDSSAVSNVQLCDDLNMMDTLKENNVQLNVTQLDSEMNLSDAPVSDCESQLVVKKDIKSTYSRKDQMKRVESGSRLRVGSTGSASDDPDTSDYEYDHIGCDDIDNDFSDLDDRCATADTDEDNAKNDVDSVNDIQESVVISTSNWKKNKVCSIPTARNGAVSHRNNLPSLCYSNKRRSRGFTRLTESNGVSDSDVDSLEAPSPLGGDMVDGPVGIENGDGTVTAVSIGRVRRRKTPVKYKDTSFFQGDFVFIDEEEEYLKQYQTKKQTAKKHIPGNGNCNTRENGSLRKQGENKKKTNLKSQVPKEKKEKQNTNLKSAVKVTSKRVCDRKLKETLNELTKEAKKQFSKLKSVQSSEFMFNKDDPENDSGLENSDSDAKKKVTDDEDKNILTRSSSKTVGARTAVATRKSSREQTKKCNNEVATKHKTDINGFKKETDKTPVKYPVLVNNIANASSSKAKSMRSKNKIDKQKVSVVIKDKDEPEVIEINSDSNDDNVKDDSASLEQDRVKLEVKRENLIEEIETRDNERSSDFKFALVEDDSIPSLDDIGQIKSSVKKEEEQVKKKVIASKKPTTVRPSNKTLENKKSSIKKKNNRKRKTVDDIDPDFEMEPMKKSLKSMKAQELESKKRKVKKDKWANFKGPKIVMEGEKDNPDKCLVINDPFEEMGSKKAKSVTQNVTRIEISHLPSDKSVLIPNSDNLDSEGWVCALCGKHSSYKFLGDLFGPYTVETMSEDMLDLSPRLSIGSGKKRRSEDGQPGTSRSGRTGKRAASVSRELNEWKEVWVHESCSVYSDGVFLIGTKIYGLQEAVRIASQTPCSRCHEMGAMIGCLNKGCHQKFHHVCAQDSDCYLDEENFSLLCPKHKVKKLMQLEASTSGVS